MRRLPRRYRHWRANIGVVLALALCVMPARADARRWVRDQLLVRPNASSRSLARSFAATLGVFTAGEVPSLGVRILQTPPGHALAVERSLRASRLFRFVERNYIAAVTSVPDDPLYGEQWALPIVRAPQVWPATRGEGITIAVVDTGVDELHPDLAGHVVEGFNAITGSTDSGDDNGHGTRMAGIAAALGFNRLGVVGVAPEAMIMPVKAMGATGSGTYADIARGIAHAVDHGARVINLSLGGKVASSTLSDAVTYAVERGVVVVAAAGNDGIQAPSYPAAYSNVIAVGATDERDVRADFSSYGAWLDLVAPGVGILTTNAGGGYADSTGTSPAAPFASAAAALVLSANPQLQPRQVASILALTDDDLGAPGFDVFYGWGRLNMERALSQAIALGATPDTGAPTVRVADPVDGSSVQGIVSLSADTSDDVGVVRVEYAVDGVVVASSSQLGFPATWDSEFSVAGPHLLTAVAYDASGNRSSSAPIVVSIAGLPPSCDATNGQCLPGGGKASSDCFAEWFVGGGPAVTSAASRAPLVRCTDGDSCDGDGTADGVCTFTVGICFAVPSGGREASGPRGCEPDELTRFQVLAPGFGKHFDSTDLQNAVALLSGVAALGAGRIQGTCVTGIHGGSCSGDADCDSVPGIDDGVCGMEATSLLGIAGSGERCTALETLRVPLHPGRSRFRPGRRRFKIATFATVLGRQRPVRDTDSLRLVCQPPS